MGKKTFVAIFLAIFLTSIIVPYLDVVPSGAAYPTLSPPTVIPSPTVIDQGQTSTLNSTLVTGGNPPYTYRWFEQAPGGNYVAVGANSTSYGFSTSSATGTYNFMLQVTDSNSAAVNSTAASVTVNAAPSVTLQGSPSPGSVGLPITFTATASGGTGALTYNFYEGTTLVQSGSDNTVSLTPQARMNMTVAVSVTDSLSVTTPKSYVSVQVDYGATYNLATLSASLIDIGSSVTDAVTLKLGSSGPVATGATGNMTYSWSTDQTIWHFFDNESIASGSATSAAFTPPTSGTFSIQATYSGDTNYLLSSSITSFVVCSAVSVGVSPGFWTMDVGQHELFTADASGGSGFYTGYQWYVGGIAQTGENSAIFDYTPTSAGAVSITVTATDSLEMTSPPSSPAQITVNSALTAPTVSPSPASVTRGESSTLTTTTPSTGTSPYMYQWFSQAPGGSYTKINGATSISYTFTTDTNTAVGTWNFKLQVTDHAGAVVDSAAAQVSVTQATSNTTPTPTPKSSGSTTTPAPGHTATSTPTSSSAPNPIAGTSATTTTTVADNTVKVDQTDETGVSVEISGSTLQNGAQVNVTTVIYGNTIPLGTNGLTVNGATFYDVKIVSNSDTALDSGVEATVTIYNPAFTSQSVIEYWDGSGWVAIETTFTAPNTVSGNIPASALTGTLLAVGVPTNVPELPSATALALIAVFTVATLILCCFRRNVGNRKARIAR